MLILLKNTDRCLCYIIFKNKGMHLLVNFIYEQSSFSYFLDEFIYYQY